MALTPLFARELFDMPDEVLWLSHCKDGPLPRASLEATRRIVDTELRPWDMDWERDFLDVAAYLRQQAALFFGAHADDISLTTCTTTGLEAVAMGYPWQPGDQVLLPAGEFPSNRLPWLALAARGVSCNEVPLWPGHGDDHPRTPHGGIQPEQALIDAITSHTRIVAVSWVRYQDGTRMDLTRLGRACRERGVHLVVDGIQGAGTVPLSLEGVSAFATGGHKGLLGMQGQGLLWTSPVLRSLLLPIGTWLSAPEAFSQSGHRHDLGDLWSQGGRRLEAGSPSILSCAALATSLALMTEAGGAAAIHAHVAGLQRALLARLVPLPAWQAESKRLTDLLDAGRLGSILSFALPQDRCHALLRSAPRHHVHTSTREGYLRIALHGWHGGTDIERIVAWLTDAQ